MITGLEYVVFAAAVGLFVAFNVLWSVHFISIIYGKYKFHKKPKRVIENDKLPGVSIIKPLTGVDDNLVDNLETFFVMDYPIYEILFCVQDNSDPAVGVVKHLIEKYPNIDARLFSGGKFVGINPKINNMVQGYDAAKYELILISDAGIKMAKDTLYDMVSLMTERVGLVHQMPFVCDRPGFAGALEKVYFGTCHCRMYLFINLIGINCVTGMSCLMRKCVLDQVGGLQHFGNYIAEDYFIAKTYLDNKWLIQLSHQPAMQNSASYSVPTWQKRMVRWCKLRLKLTVMSWLEPIQECIMLGLATSWTVNYLFGWNSLVFFLIHVLCWFLSDYTLLKITQNGRLPFSKMDYVISWFYRETICYLLFLKAAANPTVRWRNGRYRLKWGGLAEEIRDPAAAATNPIGPDLKIQINNNETALQLTPHLSPVANDYDYDDEYDIYEFEDQENNGSSKALASQNINGSNSNINSSANNSSNNGFNKAAILGSLMAKKQPVGSNGGNTNNNTLTNKKSGLSHKRTSSYSVMMMKQQQQQQNSSNTYMKHSDGEGSGPTSSPLLLQLHPQSSHHNNHHQQQQQQMTKFTTQNSIGGSNNSLASTSTNTTTGSTIVLNPTITNSRTAAQLLKHANGMMNANQISSSSSYQSQSSLNSAQLLLQQSSAPVTPADTRINMFMADSDANNNSISKEKEGNNKYTKLI